MKKKTLALFCLLLPLTLLAQETKENVHISKLFNFDWKFQAGKVQDAPSVGCDDSSWRNLDLPHDFQIEQPWDKSTGRGCGFKAMGEGWYRKTFKANPAWKGRKVFYDRNKLPER